MNNKTSPDLTGGEMLKKTVVSAKRPTTTNEPIVNPKKDQPSPAVGGAKKLNSRPVLKNREPVAYISREPAPAQQTNSSEKPSKPSKLQSTPHEAEWDFLPERLKSRSSDGCNVEKVTNREKQQTKTPSFQAEQSDSRAKPTTTTEVTDRRSDCQNSAQSESPVQSLSPTSTVSTMLEERTSTKANRKQRQKPPTYADAMAQEEEPPVVAPKIMKPQSPEIIEDNFPTVKPARQLAVAKAKFAKGQFVAQKIMKPQSPEIIEDDFPTVKPARQVAVAKAKFAKGQAPTESVQLSLINERPKQRSAAKIAQEKMHALVRKNTETKTRQKVGSTGAGDGKTRPAAPKKAPKKASTKQAEKRYNLPVNKTAKDAKAKAATISKA